MRKLLCFLCLMILQLYFSQVVERNLSTEKWTFKQEGKNESLIAKVPGTVHSDLFKNKKIPDPFYGDNESKLQWIEDENWIYQTKFSISEKEFQKKNIELIFEGLDTYAEVFLNEQKILSANNMFRNWQIDAKNVIKKSENTLKIQFNSASKKGKELAKLLPYELPEKERVFVRKAQYHFGWDWGPRFVTAGIWKPILLKTWDNAKIEHINFNQKISNKKADLQFFTEIFADSEGNYTLAINEKKYPIHLKKGKNKIAQNYTIKNPQLWYPNGFGKPHLYLFNINLLENNQIIQQKKLNIGLRTIELVQENDQAGKSFYFKVNGIPVYIKGSNVIPPHSFLTEKDPNIYKKWISEAKFANMNMLRIWGGGIYGDNEFYEETDKNGILVWQDFMFACSMYPGDKNFLDNVREEVKDQVRRLENHPSLALWCGNNENEEGWVNWGWQKQHNYSKSDSTSIWKDYLATFESTIPETLSKNSAQKPIYWRSSPSNGWGKEIAYKQGDVHYWGVWWGMEPFEKYREKTGRFVSEYGFQGMPPLSTFLSFTEKDSLNLNSKQIKAHQKHKTGYETITQYMKRDYKVPKNFEDFAYVSQLLQARGKKIAVEAHRQKKPYNMGTLYWQFNDVWPVTSWSSVDFFGNRKAAHYQFKKSFEPIFLSAEETNNTYKIWINNDSNIENKGEIDIELFDFEGKKLYQKSKTIIVEKLSNSTPFEISKSEFSNFDLNKSVLKMSFKTKNNYISELYYFVKPKDLVLKQPKITTKFINDTTIEITTDYLAKDVYLIQNEVNNFDNNFFDLLPGETKTIRAEKPIRDLRIKTLFDVN